MHPDDLVTGLDRPGGGDRGVDTTAHCCENFHAHKHTVDP
jgi:hypothetical protein